MRTRYNSILAAIIVSLVTACNANEDYPGLEYAPQMYHSVPYEPLSFVEEEGIDGLLEESYYITNYVPTFIPNAAAKINMLEPVEGTVKRQNYASATGSNIPTPGKALLVYNLHKDSIDLAAATLKNPLPNNEDLVAEGKHLYLGFCAPCHGENGDGQGKVGGVYKGVPNYSAGRYATLSEGHIFHTITHGKGRMWPHKSQINPEERWKIVRYVQKLQKGEK